MKKWCSALWASFSLLLAAGCGTGVKTLGKKTEQQPSTCPAAMMVPFHEVTIHFSSPAPAKLALVLEGEREFSECEKIQEKPPVVSVKRESGNTLVLLVQHFGAYESPPKDMTFKLMDLGDCSTPEKEILAVEKLPLQFETDYPNGPKCGKRTYARVQIIKQ